MTEKAIYPLHAHTLMRIPPYDLHFIDSSPHLNVMPKVATRGRPSACSQRRTRISSWLACPNGPLGLLGSHSWNRGLTSSSDTLCSSYGPSRPRNPDADLSLMPPTIGELQTGAWTKCFVSSRACGHVAGMVRTESSLLEIGISVRGTVPLLPAYSTMRPGRLLGRLVAKGNNCSDLITPVPFTERAERVGCDETCTMDPSQP
ncbi:hypothetical protein F4780DRAFT_500372 [Xylariomycetidae sp. FL0641]|nr:hypothetical protein F4780DRAFT_500372 [Xylariomycetidae sp. FL0641]